MHSNLYTRRLAPAFATCAVVALLVASACSQTRSTPSSTTYHGAGVVIWVDAEAGSIKIDHEEIKDLMPAMKMKFVVRDKSLLNDLHPNDRVEFDVVEAVEGYVITAIKKVGGE